MKYMICLTKRNNPQISSISHSKIKTIKENKWCFKTVSINMISPSMRLKINIKSRTII